MRFSFSQQGAVNVVQIEGAMTTAELKPLTDALQSKVERGQPKMLMDLVAVPTVDSATLEMLVETQESCRRRGGVLKLTGLNPLCREVLSVTGLERRFEFFDNQLTALGSFAT